MKEKRKFSSQEYLQGLSSLYVITAVMMNIFAMKALSFGSSVIICDGGLLISWGVFLISNVIVEVWGKRKAVDVATFAALVALVIMLLGRLEIFPLLLLFSPAVWRKQ